MLSRAAFEKTKFCHEKLGVPEQKKSLAKILKFQMQYATACSRLTTGNITIFWCYYLYLLCCRVLHLKKQNFGREKLGYPKKKNRLPKF